MSRCKSLTMVVLISCFCSCNSVFPFEAQGLHSIETLFQVVAPQPPAEPALPRFTPCPSGWVERGSNPILCEPWVDDVPPSCTGDEAAFVGEAECHRVGTACTADDWADMPAGRTVLYVKEGAVAGGDGSRGAPFSTLKEAIAVVSAESIVALSKGTHVSVTPLPAHVTVWGACVGQTTVTGSASSTEQAAFVSHSPGISVKNLTITGPRAGLWAEGTSAQFDVEDVVIQAVTAGGLVALTASQIMGRNVVVRDTASAKNVYGRAVMVQEASRVELDRVFFDNNRDVGVLASGAGTRVVLRDAVIMNTQSLANGTFGIGVQIERFASGDFTRTVVAGNRESGMVALSGGQIVLTDVVVRDSQEGISRHDRGQGLVAQDGSITGARVRLQHNRSSGVWANSNQSVVTLIDVAIVDTVPNSSEIFGVGASANEGGLVNLERAYVKNNVAAGVIASSPGSKLQLTDALVIETQQTATSNQGDWAGEGLSLVTGATAVLNRVRFERNHTIGALLLSPGTSLQATDVSVVDTLPNADGEGGGGLVMAQEAKATVTRFHIDRSFVTGLDIRGPNSELSASDLRVSHTQPRSRDSAYGHGVVAGKGARLTGERVAVSESQMVGLLVSDRDTNVAMSEVSIQATELRDCGSEAWCQGVLPSGLAALNESRVSLRRFLIADNQGIGVLVATNGQADLSEGEVSFHEVGACVMDSQFDLNRLSADVSYRHNAQKLSATVVPLPELPPTPR